MKQRQRPAEKQAEDATEAQTMAGAEAKTETENWQRRRRERPQKRQRQWQKHRGGSTYRDIGKADAGAETDIETETDNYTGEWAATEVETGPKANKTETHAGLTGRRNDTDRDSGRDKDTQRDTDRKSRIRRQRQTGTETDR